MEIIIHEVAPSARPHFGFKMRFSILAEGERFARDSRLAVTHLGLGTSSQNFLLKILLRCSNLYPKPVTLIFNTYGNGIEKIIVAEGERFELSRPFRVCHLSKVVH